jgi:hypothetical protein
VAAVGEIGGRCCEVVDEMGDVMDARGADDRIVAAVVLVDQFDHEFAPLPVRRRVVEARCPAADANVGDLDVFAHEERTYSAGGPGCSGTVDVVDGVGDLNGRSEHEPRR